jgi:hypothetical protein
LRLAPAALSATILPPLSDTLDRRQYDLPIRRNEPPMKTKIAMISAWNETSIVNLIERCSIRTSGLVIHQATPLLFPLTNPASERRTRLRTH